MNNDFENFRQAMSALVETCKLTYDHALFVGFTSEQAMDLSKEVLRTTMLISKKDSEEDDD